MAASSRRPDALPYVWPGDVTDIFFFVQDNSGNAFERIQCGKEEQLC
jgi:hypothetical protein